MLITKALADISPSSALSYRFRPLIRTTSANSGRNYPAIKYRPWKAKRLNPPLSLADADNSLRQQIGRHPDPPPDVRTMLAAQLQAKAAECCPAGRAALPNQDPALSAAILQTLIDNIMARTPYQETIKGCGVLAGGARVSGLYHNADIVMVRRT